MTRTGTALLDQLNRVLVLLLLLLPLMLFPPSIPLIALLPRPLCPLLALMPAGFRSPGSLIGGYAPGNGSISATGESVYGSGNGSRDSLQIMDLLPFPVLSSLLILLSGPTNRRGESCAQPYTYLANPP